VKVLDLSSSPATPGSLRRLATVIAAVLFLAAGALIAYGWYVGHYIRPTSDDWCALAKTRDLGVWGITSDYYETQNGRLANAFVTGLVYSFGLVGPQVLPIVLSVALAAGLTLVFRQVWRLLGWQVPLLLLLAAATVLSAVLYFASTNPYQALLWAPATISHLLASIIALWVVAFGLHAARVGSPRRKWAALALVLAAGLFIGTLSEPFVAMGGVLAGTGLLLALPRYLTRRDWYPAAWCLTACVGMVVGFAILYTSPGAAWRRAQTPNAPSMLSARELKGTAHDWLHILNVVTGQWIYLAVLAAGVLLGLATTAVPREEHQAPQLKSRWVRWAVLLLPPVVVAIGSFGVALGLRQGYGPTGWMYVRTWTNFLIPALLGLAMYGVLIGRWARARLGVVAPGRALVPAVALAMVACGAFVLAASAQLIAPAHAMDVAAAKRAVLWDQQDARLRQEVASGVSVLPYHRLTIASLGEPFTVHNPAKDLIGQCTARYYHVDRLTLAK
jgi:hypothetical protein